MPGTSRTNYVSKSEGEHSFENDIILKPQLEKKLIEQQEQEQTV